MATVMQAAPHGAAAEPARNAPCPCGSGEKYKRCCGAAGAPRIAAANAPASTPAGANLGPVAARPLLARGIQLLRAGKAGAAVPLLTAAIEAGGAPFEAYHALGTALTATGRFADASAILAHAVSLQPSSAAALWDLGAAYDHQNLHEQAIKAYQRAVALAPHLADVQLRLGQILAMYSRNEEASASLDRAAEAKSDTPEARLYRSDAALLRGDIAAAEAWAREAVALAPQNAAANGGLAGILISQGRFDEAAQCFEAALRLQPRTGKFWLGLAQCRKYSPADAAIVPRMASMLQRDDLPDHERMVLHFANGKVLEDCGEYPAAMAQYDAANALRARFQSFDRAALEALVSQAIAIYTPEFLAAHAAHGASNDKPVFIVGMYRSGTTLVEQILSCHPAVAAGGELTVWHPTELDPDPATGISDPQRRDAAIRKYQSALNRIGPEAARVTDKLPANLFRLGAIHAMLPRARIIHCQRDPIDTCLSIYTTHFANQLPFAARRDDLAFYYRQYARMMAHWRAVLPPDVFMEVSYEQLIGDREAQTRRLIGFTGIAWDEACLRPEQNDRPISTASAWQARQPIYATSVARWRRFEGPAAWWAQ